MYEIFGSLAHCVDLKVVDRNKTSPKHTLDDSGERKNHLMK